ncbi:hypothetical protein D3C71_1799070 [compost metagenome]
MVGKKAAFLSGGGTQLAAQGESILILTGNIELQGDVFGGLRHRIHTVQRFHLRIDKPPAHGGVFQFHRPAESAFRLAHDEGRAGHALYATGNHQFAFTCFYRARRHRYRIQAGATQAIKGAAGDL